MRHKACGRAAAWATTLLWPSHRTVSALCIPVLMWRFPRSVHEADGRGMRAAHRRCFPTRGRLLAGFSEGVNHHGEGKLVRHLLEGKRGWYCGDPDA